MPRHILIYLYLFIQASFSCFAQRDSTSTIPVVTSFPDSVALALRNTRNIMASISADGFIQIWSSLTTQEQQHIQAHLRLMKKKGYKIRPHVQSYIDAIIHARQTEKTDNEVFGSFLATAQKVIENYPPSKAQHFLLTSVLFFQHHAIHFDKGFRLYVGVDPYFFDYIESQKPVLVQNESPSYDTIDTWINEQPLEDPQETDDPWADEKPALQNDVPRWMNMIQIPVPPIVEGPVIVFEKTTLNFVTRYDSVFLTNTKGTYCFNTDTFIGEGGIFDFSSALLPPDQVFAELGTYFFKANNAEIKSELAKLTYTTKTPQPVPGRFEFKSIPRKDSTASTYPHFISYESNNPIVGVGKQNTTFRGGLSLKGNKFSSESLLGESSVLEISKEGRSLWKAESPTFSISDSTITSQQARLSIYHGSDSITHPMVEVYYTFPQDSAQKLVVLSSKSYMRYAPYSSSFFNIDFMVNKLDWNFLTDSMDLSISGGRSTVPMIIESTDYYDPDDYKALNNEAFSFHPLAIVANYCLQKKIREFYIGNLALFYKRDVVEIRNAISFLAQKGMVDFNMKQDFVTVKEKAIKAYLSQQKKRDYDNLKIHSVIDSLPNATLNLAKRQMTVRGVESFQVSDSLNCIIIPDSSTIVLLQNRDMEFNGKISAGNFEIVGKEFTMKYDSFMIILNKIDSIGFFVMEKDAHGQTIRRRMDNTLQGADSLHAAVAGITRVRDSKGTLYISRPNNKSGRIKTYEYPRLNASSGGVIYFNRKEILNNAYDRSIFFVVPPFTLDSLNDADPSTINFEGVFSSNGMFPNFNEKLHTMPDKTLGFDHTIPREGYSLYKSEAILTGAISLDKRGIRGLGSIDYLATHVRSDNFVFYPDSVVGKGTRAWTDRQQIGDVFFPQASFPEYEMMWSPKKDRMNLKSTRKNFTFYDSTAQLKGSVTISKKGLSGEGLLITRGSEIQSKEIDFISDQFRARHSDFKLLSADPNKPALAGKNVRVRFNLTENQADISPEIEGDAAIEFPYAQFKTSIPKAQWDLTTQKITMSKDKNVPIENSYFYTTRKDLDSLRFNAEKAEYDIKKQELKVSGIPYIIVADAKITPDKNEVLILENAQIGTLKNTTIVIDTLNGYHRLTDGVIDIKSRNEFSGYATYQYVNSLKDTFAIQLTDFHLEEIVRVDSSKKTLRKRSEKSLQTVANGVVDESKKLILGAGMFYKGDMKMYASRPALELKGFVKLDVKKIPNYNAWIQYEQTGEQTGVYIDFDKAITEDEKKVDAGLHFDATDNNLYMSFLSDKRNETDEDFYKPSGSLFYDTETKEYKIEDLQKAAGAKLSGKVFSYNDNNQNIWFEGPVNFFPTPPSFKITTTVIGRGNLETNEMRMNALVLIEPKIPTAVFDLMARDMQTVIENEGANEGLGDMTELLYKVADIVGEKEARVYETLSQERHVSLGTLAGTAKPLNFANVNFKWSTDFKAFYSEGNLGLSNIGRNDINASFEGFMEVKRDEGGMAIFNVFVKASPESWYYFGYENNRLLVHSSNAAVNQLISKKTNSGKAKMGEMVFIPGSEDETLAFINRFRKNYYGIDVPYNLSSGTVGAKKKEEETEKEDDGF